MERLLVHEETWVLCANMVRKDVACPRMQLFEADNEMTAITWESSQERFRHLLGFSWEEECWDSLVSFDLWADVGESCFLSPWDWPPHPSIPLCHPQSGSVPTLPAVQTCCVCKDPDDSLSCYRCHGDYSSLSGSHSWECSRRSQQVAGLFCDQQAVWIMWFQWTHPGPSISWTLWMALQPTPL